MCQAVHILLRCKHVSIARTLPAPSISHRGGRPLCEIEGAGGAAASASEWQMSRRVLPAAAIGGNLPPKSYPARNPLVQGRATVVDAADSWKSMLHVPGHRLPSRQPE